MSLPKDLKPGTKIVICDLHGTLSEEWWQYKGTVLTFVHFERSDGAIVRVKERVNGRDNGLWPAGCLEVYQNPAEAYEEIMAAYDALSMVEYD